jgi:hypothetical protein
MFFRQENMVASKETQMLQIATDAHIVITEEYAVELDQDG